MAPVQLPPIDIGARIGQYVERSDGLHLSRITGDILVVMDPDKYGKGPNHMNFWMGLLFEHVLEMAWADKEMGARPELIRPGEITVDGIIGTPDAYDTLLGRPEEFKFTKKSLNTPITDRKFWAYWVQLKAYAYMLGVNSGVLRVLFVNGNYKYDDTDESGYVMRCWEDEWSDLQLKENWLMLRKHAMSRGWL